VRFFPLSAQTFLPAGMRSYYVVLNCSPSMYVPNRGYNIISFRRNNPFLCNPLASPPPPPCNSGCTPCKRQYNLLQNDRLAARHYTYILYSCYNTHVWHTYPFSPRIQQWWLGRFIIIIIIIIIWTHINRECIRDVYIYIQYNMIIWTINIL